jgi:hypothetical protein
MISEMIANDEIDLDPEYQRGMDIRNYLSSKRSRRIRYRLDRAQAGCCDRLYFAELLRSSSYIR